MRTMYFLDAAGQMQVSFDYKAEQANRPTSARRHKTRKQVAQAQKWSDGNRGGTVLKRLFK